MTNVIERYEREIYLLSPEERLQLAALILNSLTQPAVESVRPAQSPRRPIGLAEGLFVVPPDFNDPLPEEILAAFEGR